jgi:hypothetical protein
VSGGEAWPFSPGSADVLRLVALQEACANIALSHEVGCECTVCRAHGGDVQALAQLLDIVTVAE